LGADFIKQGTRTIVISTYPTEIAILHEFLHPFIMDITEDNLGDFIQQILGSECVK
jgi:hypothetical protein